MMRHFAGATLSAAVVAILTVAATSHAEDYVTMGGAVSPQLATSELEGAAAADESLPMSMTMRLRNPDELDSLIAAQQNPSSPQYRRWITSEEFAERFGARPAAYDALVAWLRQQGFTVRTWPNRA